MPTYTAGYGLGSTYPVVPVGPPAPTFTTQRVPLRYTPSRKNQFVTLIDDFSVDTKSTKWPGGYGITTISGGVVTLSATSPDQSSLSTGSTNLYDLTDSYAYVKMTTPTNGVGGQPQVLFDDSTGNGNDYNFEWAAGTLTVEARTGYFDPASATVPVTAGSSIWVGVAEGAGRSIFGATGTPGNVYMYTSTDGVTWILRKTIAKASFTSRMQAALNLKNSSGTTTTTFDNFNVAPTTSGFSTTASTSTAVSVTANGQIAVVAGAARSVTVATLANGVVGKTITAVPTLATVGLSTSGQVAASATATTNVTIVSAASSVVGTAGAASASLVVSMSAAGITGGTATRVVAVGTSAAGSAGLTGTSLLTVAVPVTASGNVSAMSGGAVAPIIGIAASGVVASSTASSTVLTITTTTLGKTAVVAFAVVNFAVTTAAAGFVTVAANSSQPVTIGIISAGTVRSSANSTAVTAMAATSAAGFVLVAVEGTANLGVFVVGTAAGTTNISEVATSTATGVKITATGGTSATVTQTVVAAFTADGAVTTTAVTATFVSVQTNAASRVGIVGTASLPVIIVSDVQSDLMPTVEYGTMSSKTFVASRMAISSLNPRILTTTAEAIGGFR